MPKQVLANGLKPKMSDYYIHLQAVQRISIAIEACGMDPQEVCRTAGLPNIITNAIVSSEEEKDSVVSSSLKHLPYHVHTALWQCMSDRDTETRLSLEAVRTYPTESYGPLAYMGMTAASVYEGITQILNRYFILTNKGYWDKRDDGREVSFVWNRLAKTKAESAANIANILGIGQAINTIAGIREPIVSRYHFKCDKPNTGPNLEREFGVQIRFNQFENALVVKRDILDNVSTYAHPGMNAHFVSLLDKEYEALKGTATWFVKLRQHLSQLDDYSDFTLDALSDALKISPRTLQRRLTAANTSFTAELDNARKNKALMLVTSSNQSFASIAYSVGFSNPAAFSRAFKRWFSCSPQQLRHGSNDV